MLVQENKYKLKKIKFEETIFTHGVFHTINEYQSARRFL